jgi:putative transposase
MLVFEAKLEGTQQQYERLDEAIRTARFVRNSCLRYWLDNLGIGKYELSAYCAVLAKEFPWAAKLNSQARQATARKSLVCNCAVLRQLQKKQTREKRLSAL